MSRYRIPLLGEVQLYTDDQTNKTQGVLELLSDAGGFKLIKSLDDLPTPVGGVIYLDQDTTYMVAGTIDLLGNRIVCAANNAIYGGSANNSILKSTGLTSAALISSSFSVSLRNIGIQANIAFNLNGDGSTTIVNFLGVQLSNCLTIGTFSNHLSVIFNTCSIVNSSGMVFSGNIRNILLNQCALDGRTGQTLISLSSLLAISNRFIVSDSFFTIFPGETGIDASIVAIIPVEGYVLDTVSFTGGGTYVSGVLSNDNKAIWQNCRGITNTASIAQMTMSGNATATAIATIAVPVKAVGTTVLDSVTQKFSMPSSNRLTYLGSISQKFKVSAIATFSSGSNDKIGIFVAKNGVPLIESGTYSTANTAGRVENAVCQAVTILNQNDIVEIFVSNDSSTSSITVSSLNVIIDFLT